MTQGDHHSARFRVSLIPGFSVHVGGEQHDFGSASAKLLALVALQPQPIDRTIAAATLWPHVRDSRASANLRTSLWRVGQVSDDIVVSTCGRLTLGPEVSVDHRKYQDLARRVLSREDLSSLVDDDGSLPLPGAQQLQLGIETEAAGQPPATYHHRVGVQGLIHCLASELLTHWYEDWLSLYQERWRQLRLHALDSLSLQLTEAGLFAAAVDAATAGVAAEPLRESGYRSLIIAHLTEGNISEAVRTHEQYRDLLERELGIAPSPRMYDLLRQATGTASASGSLGHGGSSVRSRRTLGRAAREHTGHDVPVNSMWSRPPG